MYVYTHLRARFLALRKCLIVREPQIHAPILGLEGRFCVESRSFGVRHPHLVKVRGVEKNEASPAALI